MGRGSASMTLRQVRPLRSTPNPPRADDAVSGTVSVKESSAMVRAWWLLGDPTAPAAVEVVLDRPPHVQPAGRKVDVLPPQTD